MPRCTSIMKSIPISQEQLTALCRRYHVTRLALFGSALREDFRPESDVVVPQEGLKPQIRESVLDSLALIYTGRGSVRFGQGFLPTKGCG